jgi:hypothetical protein
MFVSIGVIAILISILGSKLVQSRLKESKNIKPGETMFIKESKEDIKRKIDKIENLNSQELDLLLNIIVSTHNTLQFQQQTYLQSSNSSNIDGICLSVNHRTRRKVKRKIKISTQKVIMRDKIVKGHLSNDTKTG